MGLSHIQDFELFVAQTHCEEKVSGGENDQPIQYECIMCVAERTKHLKPVTHRKSRALTMSHDALLAKTRKDGYFRAPVSFLISIQFKLWLFGVDVSILDR